MSDNKLRDVVAAMVDDAAKRLMIVDGIRGVAITLIHDDGGLPLGTVVFRDGTPRDIVLGIRKMGDTQEILTRTLMDHLDGRTRGAREGSTGVGGEEDVRAVPDGSSPPDQPEGAGTSPAAEEQTGEPG
jgi:hypothetical protein